MTKAEFKEIENRLYNFYKKDEIINSLKHQIQIIEKQIDIIKIKIKNIDIAIDDGIQAVGYGDKVQTSASGTSYAEKAITREIEQLELEIIRKQEVKNRLEKKIRDLELDNSILEFNINGIREKDRKFLEQKYKYHMADWRLAQDIHVSEITALRIRRKLVNNVANWIIWLKS